MEGFLDLINDILSQDWLENTQHLFGTGLTDDMIVQSVQEASDFFNIDSPVSVRENWTTGVMTGIASTAADDILIFNREQMSQMGITDKEGFDLVMTHEGAHRALQNIETGFTSHQEELCCDYMAGVRAGLNGMDEGKMTESIENTHESSSHPDGKLRVEAIEEGVAFANDYMEKHSEAPTFTECLEHFETTDSYSRTISNIDGTDPAVSENNDGLKSYSSSEIESHKSKAEHEMDVQKSYMRHHANIAAKQAEAGEPHNLADSQYNYAKSKYDEALAEYRKWDSMKPDDLKGLWIDDREYHLKEARNAQGNVEYYQKQARAAFDRGDFSAAKSHTQMAESCERTRCEHLESAKKCTK